LSAMLENELVNKNNTKVLNSVKNDFFI
jgi:hypothetical protein